MQILLYIVLGISVVALTYLLVVVIRGGNKNSKSFQKELAEREAKKTSKNLAESYINKEITFEELKAKITNQKTITRIIKFTEKCTELEAEIEKLQNENADLKLIKSKQNELRITQHELRQIITSYSFGSITGTSTTRLTRSEKAEEKAALKAVMKEKKAQWKIEDARDDKQVKENVIKLKAEVAESKIRLAELEKAYKEELAIIPKEEMKAYIEAEKAYYDTKTIIDKAETDLEIRLEDVNEAKSKINEITATYNSMKEVYEEKYLRIKEKENQYREFKKEHERLLHRLRIEKDKITIIRKIDRWSKRGGHLRREIFVKRQYYYLVAPYTILFVIFTVVPVLMSLYFSFTYFNLLETPTFTGWENYMRLFVDDKVFIIAIRNTAVLAVITGPLSYLMAFLFAWLINELKPLVRSIMTLIFYAPSISGNVYLVWKLIFSSDIYGYANSILLQLNLIKEPITWLQDAKYIIWILIIVQLWLSLGVSFLAFIAGLQSVNRELYEAGAIDGIKNRWQELWYITLPQMKSQLLFGAVMQITSSLSVAEVSTAIAGFPSIEYAGHTIITHLMDYGSIRMEMGYASAIATILFIIMIAANLLVRKILRRVGS